MTKLSFRQAKLKTGQSVGAIQNALKRGDLPSLDKDELEIWTYGRPRSPKETAVAFGAVYRIWTGISCLMMREMEKNEKDKHIDIQKKWIFEFSYRALDMNDDDKYYFSESFIKVVDTTSEFLNVARTVDERFYYCLYYFTVLNWTDFLNIATGMRVVDPTQQGYTANVSNPDYEKALGIHTYKQWRGTFAEMLVGTLDPKLLSAAIAANKARAENEPDRERG